MIEYYRKDISLSEGIKMCHIKVSASALFSYLEGRGVIEIKKRRSRKDHTVWKEYKAITNEWLRFGFNKVSRFGHGGTTPRFYSDNFSDLMIQIGLIN